MDEVKRSNIPSGIIMWLSSVTKSGCILTIDNLIFVVFEQLNRYLFVLLAHSKWVYFDWYFLTLPNFKSGDILSHRVHISSKKTNFEYFHDYPREALQGLIIFNAKRIAIEESIEVVTALV